uniref:Ankyrin repeat protein n=1 Tax=Trichogramma kaykai TaxID=54128 RepID=A0ABD2XES2_9HYME
MEEIRSSFLRKLFHFIRNYEGQHPNIRDIFSPEAIDFLLMESIKSEDQINSKAFIDFVIKTGYKDEPTVDVDDKPLLYRTTPVHSSFRRASLKCDSRIPSLFEVYNRFDVNYIDESGLTHFHVACMIQGCDEIVEKFLELG